MLVCSAVTQPGVLVPLVREGPAAGAGALSSRRRSTWWYLSTARQKRLGRVSHRTLAQPAAGGELIWGAVRRIGRVEVIAAGGRVGRAVGGGIGDVESLHAQLQLVVFVQVEGFVHGDVGALHDWTNILVAPLVSERPIGLKLEASSVEPLVDANACKVALFLVGSQPGTTLGRTSV